MTYPFLPFGLASITQRRGYLSQISKLHRGLRYFRILQIFASTIRDVSDSEYRSSQGQLICTKRPEQCSTADLSHWLVSDRCDHSSDFSRSIGIAPPNIETFEDLKNFATTFYGSTSFTSYFEELNFRGRVVGLQNFDCKEYVLKDDAAACVND